MKKFLKAALLIFLAQSATLEAFTLRIATDILDIKFSSDLFGQEVADIFVSKKSNPLNQLIKTVFEEHYQPFKETVINGLQKAYLTAAENVYKMSAELQNAMSPLEQLYALLLPTAQEKDAFIRSSIAGGLFATYFLLNLKDKKSSFLRRLYNRLSIIAYGSVVGGSIYLVTK